MRELITGHGDNGINLRIAEFIAANNGFPGMRWLDYTTIGLMDNGEILAGLLYEQWNGVNVISHVAGRGKNWMNRELLWYSFYYPFVELGCKRLTGMVRSTNIDAIRLVLHLGYEAEAVLKEASGPGVDTVVFRMWRDNCRWLKLHRKENGKVRSFSAAAA